MREFYGLLRGFFDVSECVILGGVWGYLFMNADVVSCACYIELILLDSSRTFYNNS